MNAISLSLNSSQSTNNFNLIMKLSVSMSSSLCKRWLKNESLLLHFDLASEDIYNSSFRFSFLWDSGELFNPKLDSLSKPGDQYVWNLLVQLFNPYL